MVSAAQLKKALPVSICIPAYNEEANIRNLLEALLSQKLHKVSINRIVVVSAKGTDKTDEIVTEFTKRSDKVFLIREPERRGKAAAINTFLKTAYEPVVVIQSADTIPKKDTIEKLCTPFLVDEKIGMTGGAPIPVNDPNTFLGYVIHAWWWFHRNIPRFGEIIAIRNILPKIVATTAVDEAFIQAKMVQQGYKVVYIDDAVVINKGPETISDLLKQRRRIFTGHARLYQDEKVKINNMTKSSLRLLFFEYQIKNLKELVWLFSGIGIEFLSRLIGMYDTSIANKNPFIWTTATTTKNLSVQDSSICPYVFVNFAPISFMGGAEFWMNKVHNIIRNYDNAIIVHMSPKIANLYGKLVLNTKFTSKKHAEYPGNVMSLSLSNFIPLTPAWLKTRKIFHNAKYIYLKYELPELFITVYFGGFSALKKSIAGMHSPFLYHNPTKFFEKLHVRIYESRASSLTLRNMAKVHVLNQEVEQYLTSSFGLTNVYHVPNSITPQKERTYARIQRPRADLRILYVGELSYRKGTDILLDLIDSSPQHFSYTIAGAGSMQDEASTRTLIHENCIYYGYIEHNKLFRLYQAADVLIIPSRAESMPLVMLEGISTGLKIVCSESAAVEMPGFIKYDVKENTANDYLSVLSSLYNHRKKDLGLLEKQKIKQYFINNYSDEKVIPKLLKDVFELKSL